MKEYNIFIFGMITALALLIVFLPLIKVITYLRLLSYIIGLSIGIIGNYIIDWIQRPKLSPLEKLMEGVNK